MLLLECQVAALIFCRDKNFSVHICIRRERFLSRISWILGVFFFQFRHFIQEKREILEVIGRDTPNNYIKCWEIAHVSAWWRLEQESWNCRFFDLNRPLSIYPHLHELLSLIYTLILYSLYSEYSRWSLIRDKFFWELEWLYEPE